MKRSYIATPASSWIDDFFDWSNATACCKMKKNYTFCPHTDSSCSPCIKNPLSGKRPMPEDFRRYISFFLHDNPDSDCAKAGHPSYGAVSNNIF